MGKEEGKGLTIFVLDDEKDVCHFVKAFFIRRGFNVYTALTGKTAINTLKKMVPDIALLDIHLSENDMNGMDILRLIKEKHPACQCLMVTYLDDKKLAEEALKAGAVDYLRKPLMLPEVESAINKLVKRIRKGEK